METEREWQRMVCPAHMNEWLEDFSPVVRGYVRV